MIDHHNRNEWGLAEMQKNGEWPDDGCNLCLCDSCGPVSVVAIPVLSLPQLKASQSGEFQPRIMEAPQSWPDSSVPAFGLQSE